MLKLKLFVMASVAILAEFAHASAVNRLGPSVAVKNSAAIYTIGLKHLESAHSDRRYVVSGYAILKVASQFGSQDAARGMAMIHSLVDAEGLRLSSDLASRIVTEKNPDGVVDGFLSGR